MTQDGPPRSLPRKKLKGARSRRADDLHKEAVAVAPVPGCLCAACAPHHAVPTVTVTPAPVRGVTGGTFTYKGVPGTNVAAPSTGQTLTLKPARAVSDQKMVVTVRSVERLQEANRELHLEIERLRQVVQASREVLKERGRMPPTLEMTNLLRAVSDLDAWDQEGVDPGETKKVIDDLLRIAGELDDGDRPAE